MKPPNYIRAAIMRCYEKSSVPPSRSDVERFALDWWGSMIALGQDGKASRIVDIIDPENFVDFACDVLYQFSISNGR